MEKRVQRVLVELLESLANLACPVPQVQRDLLVHQGLLAFLDFLVWPGPLDRRDRLACLELL